MIPNDLLISGEIESKDPADNDFLLQQLFDYQTVQLATGKNCRNIKYAATSGVVCYHETVGAPLHSIGTIRDNRLALLLPRSERGLQMWGNQVEEHRIPVVRSGIELDISQQNNIKGIVLVCDFSLLENLQDTGNLNSDALVGLDSMMNGSSSEGFIRCPRASMSPWAEFFAAQLDALQDPSLKVSAEKFNKMVIGTVLSLAEESSATGYERAKPISQRQLVAKAIELDAANTYSPCIIPLLCGELHCSRRKLEMAFREVVGISPLKYLNLFRMNRFYRDLALADPLTASVTSIAAKHGFTELGRLAGKFKHLFGELPLQTLQSARIRNQLILPS